MICAVEGSGGIQSRMDADPERIRGRSILSNSTCAAICCKRAWWYGYLRVRQDGGSQPAAIDAIGTNRGRRQESTRVGDCDSGLGTWDLGLGKRVGPAWSWCPGSPLNGSREREGDVDPSRCFGRCRAFNTRMMAAARGDGEGRYGNRKR